MRISRHQMFMKTAEVQSLRATCFRRSVGAVIVLDNNIISTGYNGPASKEEHCTGKNCPSTNGCTRAIHAEHNAIKRMPEWTTGSLLLKGLYTTESPCPDCAQLIIETPGLRYIFFMHEYRKPEALDLLIGQGIAVFRMTASGYVINHRTGELVEE